MKSADAGLAVTTASLEAVCPSLHCSMGRRGATSGREGAAIAANAVDGTGRPRPCEPRIDDASHAVGVKRTVGTAEEDHPILGGVLCPEGHSAPAQRRGDVRLDELDVGERSGVLLDPQTASQDILADRLSARVD